MAYTTLSLLIDQFGTAEVTASADRDKDGSADTDVVTRAIEHSDGLIDSYVGVKFKTPLDPVPKVVQRIAGDIALYTMSAEVGVYTDEKRKRYDDAIRWLEQVAAGKATIGGDEPDTKITGRVRATAGARSWGRDDVGGLL